MLGLFILFTDPDEPVLRIGRGSFDFLEYDVGESDRLVGFHGAQNDRYISELGFIIFDTKPTDEQCIESLIE